MQHFCAAQTATAATTTTSVTTTTTQTTTMTIVFYFVHSWLELLSLKSEVHFCMTIHFWALSAVNVFSLPFSLSLWLPLLNCASSIFVYTVQFHKQFRHENKSGQAATALPSPASHSLSFSRICFLSLRTCELAALCNVCNLCPPFCSHFHRQPPILANNQSSHQLCSNFRRFLFTFLLLFFLIFQTR